MWLADLIFLGLGVFAAVTLPLSIAEIVRRHREAEGRANDPNDPEEPRRG